MPVMRTQNVETYYEIHGEGEPLVLINGLSYDICTWQLILPELSRHFKVIVFDNRCSGRTYYAGPDFGMGELASDVSALINALEIESAHILGYSMGGCIAMNLAKLYPHRIKKLILLHTVLRLTAPALQTMEGVALVREQYQVPVFDLVGITAPWSFSESFLEDEANLLMLQEQYKRHEHPQSVQHYRKQYRAFKQFDGNKLVDALTMPTLIICGEKDLLTPAAQMRELAARLPNAKYVEQPGGAHISPIEAPALLTKDVIQFLK